MKKTLFFFSFMLLAFGSVSAQKLFTRTGKVHFFSKTPMEAIEAVNNGGTAVLDLESGKIEYTVLIKGFLFEKALMQEHFNENYMESSKFPKATFKGSFAPSALNLSKDGNQSAEIVGQLTLHGVTKDIKTKVDFVVKGGKVSAKTTFLIIPQDYGIEIPAVVKDNIAKEIKVTVESALEPLEKSK